MPSSTPEGSVSIIIAAWNAEATIKAAVDSALGQTTAPLEVIVVDDGSDDATADVIASLFNPLVRLIRQENRGQSAALNRGIAESRGRFIKFLDADDVLNPDHIAAQLDALANSTTALASCRWGYFVGDPAGTTVRREVTNRNYDNPVDWIVDSLSRDDGMMGGWLWLIPRDVLKRAGGWNEQLSLNNDFDFSIRLLLASSGVRFASRAIYCYRKGVGQALSATRGDDAMLSGFATTEAGCRALLDYEDSQRTRLLCANRWQWWMYQFYPQQPDLASRAEAEVARLGGSRLKLQGGTVLRLLLPVIGWKRLRRLQTAAYSRGWGKVLKWKSSRMLKRMATPSASKEL